MTLIPGPAGADTVGAGGIPGPGGGGTDKIDDAGDRPRPKLVGPMWGELAAELEDDAAEVVAAAVEHARVLGVVTTAHIAAALIETDGTALARTVSDAGVPRALLADLLRDSTGIADSTSTVPAEQDRPTGDPVDSSEVRMSANVARILQTARRLAHPGDRVKMALTDLAEAWLQIGGSSAEVLRAVGVHPELIRAPLADSGATSLFDKDNRLLVRYLDRETRSALKAARLLGAAHKMKVSRASLLLGFALTGSAVLRRALLEQGAAGEAAVNLFYPDALIADPSQPKMKDFSAGAFQALEAALTATRETGGESVSDASVLAETLADPAGSACGLLAACGVDAARLEAALRRLAESTESES
jgi:hypothetical protein